tara:strand:- start:2827 stop:4647 length:1821 start_codon:yes stop_codon:yes gene_type:complete
MDIFELNKKTRTDIIIYNTFDIRNIVSLLIKKNILDDAIVLMEYIDNFSSTNELFIHWLKKNNKLKMNDKDIIFLCINGLLNQSIGINISKYIKYCIQSNNLLFIKYIIKKYNIKKIKFNSFYHCNNYIILKYIINYTTLNKFQTLKMIKKICRTGNISSFIFMIEKYDYILKDNPQILFKIAFINNNIDILKYLLSYDVKLCLQVKPYYIMGIKNMSYKCIQYIHYKLTTLSYKLYNTSEYNDILIYIISTRKKIPILFFKWYLKKFCHIVNYNYIIKNLFDYNHLNIIKLLSNFINYKFIKSYFLTACYNGNINIVKFLHKKINKKNLIIGLNIICNNNHNDCFEFFKKKTSHRDLYALLYRLINNKYNNTFIIKQIYLYIKPIYPLKLPLYLCLKNDFIWWIKLNEKHFIKFLDYYLNIICYFGYFDTFLYIKKYFTYQHFRKAFKLSCEEKEGIFIAKWIYHNYSINLKLIEDSLFYSNNIDTIKWLFKLNPNIDLRKNNNAYFIYNCIKSNITIVEWIKSIYNHYSYTVYNDIILEYTINLYYTKQKNIFINEICSICLTKNSNCITTCNHMFCYDCINMWYLKNNTCPICRKIMNDVILH